MQIDVMFFVAEDWYFVSHRLCLAKRLVRKGIKVGVICRVGQCGDLIAGEGIAVFAVEIDRSSRNLMRNLLLTIKVSRILLHHPPLVLHNVAQKSILIGTLAALLCGVPRVINAFTGLGSAFMSDKWRLRTFATLLSWMYKLLLLSSRMHVIVQNHDDMTWVCKTLNVPNSRVSLIRGAGVDIDYFSPSLAAPSTSVPVVTLVARMLRDKGVVEFCEAARILKSRGVAARFLLVGDPDPLNPTSLTEAQLLDFTKIGVEYLGRSNDIKGIWQESDISVLPSYREGLPLSLLESAAMGKPIVTTDVPGCREVVDDGVNGFLVPPKDPEALANAIEKLALDPELRRRFGRASRKRAVKEFSSDRVIADTLVLYEYQ